MQTDRKSLYRLGGLCSIASGVLFLVRYALEAFAGPPPSDAAGIVAWAEANRSTLAWVSEVLFFATGLLIPAVAALYASLVDSARARATAGCGLLATAITLLAATLVVHGRLVYPIYGIRVGLANAELLVAVYYGGIHAVWLLLAFGTILVSLAMAGGPFGRGVAFLGYVTAAADVAASYPWLLGTLPHLLCQLLFTGWLITLGAKLLRWPHRGP